MTREEQNQRHAEVLTILQEAGAKIKALGACPTYIIILPDMQGQGFHSIGNGMTNPACRGAIAVAVARVLDEATHRQTVRN